MLQLDPNCGPMDKLTAQHMFMVTEYILSTSGVSSKRHKIDLPRTPIRPTFTAFPTEKDLPLGHSYYNSVICKGQKIK